MTNYSGNLTLARNLSTTAEGPAPAALLAPAAASELSPSPAQPPAARRGRARKLLLAGAGLAALAGVAYFGWQYWNVGRFEVATDDAYVQADNTTIAPKVSGYIGAVLVGDNERVRAGQVLARIDDRDFKVALEQARADVAAAEAVVATKRAQLGTQQSIIQAARATIGVDQATHAFAQQDNKRYKALAATGFGSLQNAEQALSRTAATQAAVARDTAALQAAIGQVDVLKGELAQAEATLLHNRAVQAQAELNLSYTTITAPQDGVVGARTLRVGQYVQAGTALMAVVPLDAAYVIANFKETQLTGVRPGQAVEIGVDTYPGVTFTGHVDSIAPASGQEFALLPPDNATGNFTKVVQRIPVKIVLDPAGAAADVLRPGMSVTPSIDTRPRKG